MRNLEQLEKSSLRIRIGATDLRSLVDFYWRALIDLQDTLEDIEGSDGRIEYLYGLRIQLLDVLQGMDSALSPESLDVGEHHQAAFALEHGLRFADLDAHSLARRMLFDRTNITTDMLFSALHTLAGEVLDGIPGVIPAAQGTQGQREVLRAMRTWFRAAEAAGENLDFLAQRLQDL